MTTTAAPTAAPTNAELRDSDHWIRPWYPGEGPIFGTGGQFIGHIYPDCEHLLRIHPEPQPGAGWLDPRQGPVCPPCLHRHDPKLHAELFSEDED